MSNEKKDNTTSFTVDADATGINEMPSVTKLLNRKSLKLASTAKKAAPKQPSDPSAIQVPQISTDLQPSEVPRNDATQVITIESNQAPVVIEIQAPEPKSEITNVNKVISLSTRTSLRRPSTAQTLVAWDKVKLAQTKDPVATVITTLFQKNKLIGAIFLPNQGENRFTATAMVANAQARLTPSLWSGLCFDFRIVPEVWKLLLAEGWIELPPPGTKTSITSARNVLRGAFGIKSDETLTLYRVGNVTNVASILACITTGSVSSESQQLVNQLAVK